MCQPNPIHQREVVWNLATGAVPHKVELRYSNTVRVELCKIEIEWWEVSREPTLEVHTPLACNVIGYKEVADPSFEVLSNRRCKGVVRIDVSTEMRLVQWSRDLGTDIPFATLKIGGTVASNKRMTT